MHVIKTAIQRIHTDNFCHKKYSGKIYLNKLTFKLAYVFCFAASIILVSFYHVTIRVYMYFEFVIVLVHVTVVPFIARFSRFVY